MKIEHIAILTSDLDRIRDFYQTFFTMQCGEKYVNSKKGFSSYFLSFESGARLEIMEKTDISDGNDKKGEVNGYADIAISVGSKEDVDKLTNRLRVNGFEIVGEPRTTGDGYFESVILDPEGNHIEITE